LTKSQQAIREFARAMFDRTGNLPFFPGIFPDYAAPIVRNRLDGRELAMARWGMPSPLSALKGKKCDPGVTNVRNVKSVHWRVGSPSSIVASRLSPASRKTRRCLMAQGRRSGSPSTSRPLGFFAGISTNWTSVRKVKEGEANNDVLALLTSEPNAVVAQIRPKAMPVPLTTQDEIDLWMSAPAEEALKLQRPLLTMLS
jgi:putative SOS response-associated peptidase YedK